MISSKLTDAEKLILIAKTFSFIKGEFTSEQLFDFILNHNYSFKKEMGKIRIGRMIARSDDFIKKDKRCGVNYFEAKV